VSHVFHRVVQPILTVVHFRVQYVAADDMAEQFVTGTIKQGCSVFTYVSPWMGFHEDLRDSTVLS